MNDDPRLNAVNLLAEVITHHRSLNDVIQDDATPLTRELCYGVLRFYPRLQYLQKKLLKKPLKAKDQDLEILILVGIYELLYLNTPAHACVNETVNVCLLLNKVWAKGLVNALLRRIQRESIDDWLKHDPAAEYAHPTWLLEILQQHYPQQWHDVVEANNQRPPFILRVNLAACSRDEYIAQLEAQGINASPIAQIDSAIQLKQACSVVELPGFERGLVSVQDAHAQLSADFLQVESGQRVLDACAAPGGKTMHLLEKQPKLSYLLALDNQAERLQKVAENLQRSQLQADLKCADANKVDDWWDNKAFDRVLLDAPCSATGVIRRHPDIKLLRRETDIFQLQQQQLTLLNSLWPTLAEGGLLLYVTCSLLPAENSDVIAKFLQQQPSACEQPINHADGLAQTHGLQFLPEVGDGFYYCLLSKNASLL